jgi:glycolate oxidase iron-sulfur subunit
MPSSTSAAARRIKDYGHMFSETDLAEDAKAVANIAMDVSEPEET